MKIWEILKEENIDKKCIISNAEQIVSCDMKYQEYDTIISKNRNGEIGIFYDDDMGLVVDIQSTDILILEFDIIK